jgi:hypothetical protein
MLALLFVATAQFEGTQKLVLMRIQKWGWLKKLSVEARYSGHEI